MQAAGNIYIMTGGEGRGDKNLATKGDRAF